MQNCAYALYWKAQNGPGASPTVTTTTTATAITIAHEPLEASMAPGVHRYCAAIEQHDGARAAGKRLGEDL